MAKLEKTLHGDFDEILKQMEEGILAKSVSATLEDKSDFKDEKIRCSVRVFERYSYMGGNRLSLFVTLFQDSQGIVRMSAITSGGK